MKKINIYLSSFWQSIKDKPFVFIIFVVSIMLGVVVSAYAYRATKEEIKNFENKASYSIKYTADFNSEQFYNDIKGSNVINVIHEYSKTDLEEDRITKESVNYVKVYIPDEQKFSRSQLDNAVKEAVITSRLAKIDMIAVGDDVDVLGTSFKVINILESNENSIYIPATVKEVVFQKDPSYISDIGFNTKGNLNKSTMKVLQASGFDIKVDSLAVNYMAMLTIFIGIIMITLAATNIFVANKFIANKNSKRYTLYLVVGAKNRDVAAVMIAESLFCVVVAFCLGAVTEYFAFKPIVNMDGFAKLGVVDYVALFFINAASVVITTAIVIFKKIYSAPMSSKQRGL